MDYFLENHRPSPSGNKHREKFPFGRSCISAPSEALAEEEGAARGGA